MGDLGEELLGVGFPIGDAALVVLVVAQGGVGVGLRAEQQIALAGRDDRRATRYAIGMTPSVAAGEIPLSLQVSMSSSSNQAAADCQPRGDGNASVGG